MKPEQPDHLTEEQLHGGADGSLAADEDRAVQRHLEACDECRSDVERIRLLLTDAGSLPRAIEPPDDLWPVIQARVGQAGHGGRPGLADGKHTGLADGARSGPADGPRTGLDDDARTGLADSAARPSTQNAALPFQRPRRQYAWLAAAALLLIIGTSTITTFIVRNERQVATVPIERQHDSIQAPARVRAVSEEYDRLDRDLARQLDEQRDKLQPETVEKVERNLRIIDRAIDEIRQALAEDPGNEALERLLEASYGQKSALLAQVSQS